MKPAKNVVQHVIALQENAAKRSEAAKKEIKVGESRPRQMALFPDDVRVIPNHLARSPLFSPVRPGRRKRRDSELLASPQGFELRVTGEQCDPADGDVFMQIIQESRGKNVGEPFTLNRGDFLKSIGRDNGRAQYLWLSKVFSRLVGTVIKIESAQYEVNMALVSKTIVDKKTGQFQVILDKDIIKMFSNNVHTYIDWDKRKQIKKRVDLCKWLQNFICTHEKGKQYHGVENLRTWSGYSSPVRKFREALAEALEELERVEIISGQSFYKENNMVRWNRL